MGCVVSHEPTERPVPPPASKGKPERLQIQITELPKITEPTPSPKIAKMPEIGQTNFNSRHLTDRDPAPEINKDRLTLINMRFCPFATRTMLVMLRKGLEFDTVNVSLAEKPQWFLDLTPTGTVPVVLRGNFVGRESVDLCHYIDEKYPEPKLGPTDPEERVLDSNLIADFGRNIMVPEFTVWMSPDADGRPAAIESLLKGLSWLDGVLQSDGRGPYFGIGRLESDGPGLIDYNLWTFFNHIRRFEDLGYGTVPLEDYPNVSKWIGLMDEDPAVKAYRVPPEVFTQHMRDHLDGKADRFDALAEEQT